MGWTQDTGRGDQLAALKQGPPVDKSVRYQGLTAGVQYKKYFEAKRNVRRGRRKILGLGRGFRLRGTLALGSHGT
jgi:hypothetical protein